MEDQGKYQVDGDPAQTRKPVAWQFFQDGEWWNGDDRIKDHRKNTEEAGFPIRDLIVLPTPQQCGPVVDQRTDVQGETPAGLYAVYLYDNWDGEGDTYWVIARKQDNGVWVSEESGKELIEHEGDELLKIIPLDVDSQPTPNLALLLQTLESAKNRLEEAGLHYAPATISARKLLASFRKGNES